VSRPSLTRRLLLTVFTVIVVFFALTVTLLDYLFRQTSERSLRELLDAQMVALIAAADPDGPESVTPTAVLETRFDTPGSGLYAEIRSASGESVWRSQSTTGSDVQFGPPLEGGERRFFYTEIAGKPIRLAVASRGIVWDLHGEPARFTFSIASSLETYEAQVASFRQQMVGWFVSLALLLVATLALLLRWLLRPVRQLEREIKQVEAGEREQLGEHWPRELAAVTSNLNALLEGERTRIKRYRDTLGNLAHSLKTPLAVMRQSLGATEPNTRATLDAEIDRMTGIIEHQMKRAAASGGVLLGQAPVEVNPVITDLRAALL
jgi:two-component system sensor histidine kinase PhoQ